MVVCKFFLQGNCRYGNGCRFEHPSGGNAGYAYTAQRQLFGGGGGQRSNNWGGGGGGRGDGGGGGGVKTFYDNKYKWVAGQSQGSQQTTPLTSTSDIVNALIAEMKEWEKNKMWPFSSVGLDKGYPCMPGFMDTSAEELRHAAYEAQKSGGIHSYVEEVQKLVNDCRSKRQALQNPTMSDKQKLMSMIEDAKVKKNRSSQNTGSSTGSSLFSSGSFGTGTTGGSTSGGVFGSGAASGTSGAGNFGQSPLSTGQTSGTFSQMTNNPFDSTSSNVFGSTSTQNTFGGTQATGFPSANPFGQQTTSQNSNLFGSGTQGGFGQNSTGTSTNNPFGAANLPGGFGQTANPFGGNTTALGNNSVFGTSAGGSALGGNTLDSRQSKPFGANNSVFGKSNQSGGLFGNTQGASSTFGQSNTGSLSSSSGIFGAASVSSSGGFGSQGQQLPTEQSNLYTPIDRLTSEELEAFKAQTFTSGKIPTKPPPRELCS